MKVLKELAVKVIAGIIVAVIVAWMFHPDVFKNGINSIDWEYTVKLLISILLVNIWIFCVVHYKFKVLNNELSNLRESLSKKTDHFYTTDEIERINAIQNLNYTNEHIACYVYPVKEGKQPEGTVPFYRLFAH